MPISFLRCLACLASVTVFSLAQAAPASDVNLLVEHDITELTGDGVTRKLHFQERVYRRANLVWVERVLPAGAHQATDHAQGGHDHKHIDLAAAARLITLEPNKSLNVRLVNAHDRVVINVPPAEYGNIGFDGNWANAWHLLDPKQLKAMSPVGGRGPWYQLKKGDTTVRVAWDQSGEFPRRVESANASGSHRKLMVVSDLPAPKQLPWTKIQGFAQKEYSDYLD